MKRRGFLGTLLAALGVPVAAVVGGECGCCADALPESLSITIGPADGECNADLICAEFAPGVEMVGSIYGRWFTVDTRGCRDTSVIYLSPACARSLSHVYCTQRDNGYHMCMWTGDGKVRAAQSGDDSGGVLVMVSC